MMRVCMISEHASPVATLGGADGGGQNVYVAHLARQLVQQGHEVDIFTRREAADQPDTVQVAPGMRVIQVTAGPVAVLPKEQLLPHMQTFGDWMRAFMADGPPYDVIHAHFFMSALVALALRPVLGVPVVVTFHALGRVRRLHQREADAFPDARFAIEDRIVAEADRIIAECPEDEADLLRLYDADPARLRMVPCGFDPDELQPIAQAEARAALGLPHDAKLVLQLGRMVPRKGVDTVISGVAEAVRHGVDARLLVVGGARREADPIEDPELARLAAHAAEERIAERVLFVGSRDRTELARYFAAADVFATMPWYEPFGITPLEAMACARPVVASDVGGLRYTVADGVTGYRVPPRDPVALGERLAMLLADPAKARAMGLAGHARVHERFTWRQVALQVEEIYRETIAKHAHDAASAPRAGVVSSAFDGLIATLSKGRDLLKMPVEEAAALLLDAFERGDKVLVCGNGGSAADAQHFAAEFVGRFRDEDRPGLPVIALNADTAFVTAWANDVGFDDVFARGVRALGQPGDVLVAISTSGRSGNIVAALGEARARGMHTIALLGGALSPAVTLADVALRVPSLETPRIQEVQTLLLHLLCELVEEQMRVANQPSVVLEMAT